MPSRFLPRLSACLALALAAVLGGGSAHGDAAGWRKTLSEKNDPDELYLVIESIKTGKDPLAAAPLLEIALGTDHPHIAIACGEALRAIGPGPMKDEEVVKIVAVGQKAKEDARQLNLARALAAWGVPEVDGPLAALAAGRRSPDVQEEALFVCALLDPATIKRLPLVYQAILTAVDRGRTSAIKLAACSTAGWLRMTEASAMLGSMVRREKDPYLGLFAVLALQRLGWNDGIGSFVHVLGSGSSDEARRACLKAVVELAGTADVPDLLSLLRHSKKDYREAGALALARLAWEGRSLFPTVAPGAPGTPLPVLPEVLDRLVKLIEEEDAWEVRDAARIALTRLGEPAAKKVRESMPQLVEFGDDDTARTAMELCAHFRVTEALKPLVRTAVHEDSHSRRMFAARALEGTDPEAAVKELVGEVQARPKAKDTELRAVRALGYVRVKSSFDALLGLLGLEGASPELLREVEFSLERLTGHRFGRAQAPIWRKWFASAKNPLHPHAKFGNRAAGRRDASAKGSYGLTKETERCVEDGLRFLEAAQHRAGWWDGNERGFGGVISCEPAYTGLSLLAYLGAGYGPQSGKYREAIRRASDFLNATQFYDGSFPVTGGGDDGWTFAYLIAMGAWGVNEAFAQTIDPAAAPQGDPILRRAAQAGIDYLVRTQTPGAGWRYSARAAQSDTSASSWVLMTLKTGDLAGLDLPAKAFDGVDSWLERCSFDITGENEVPADLAGDYDYEVGSRRKFKAFTGYFELGGAELAKRQCSMTAVAMTCRFFMGWKRSHPFQIGAANFLLENLPQWMVGTDIPSYHYYWYYGTLAMYQMGGRYWRAWNERIRRMYPEKQTKSPPELNGSWEPEGWKFAGGRLFATAVAILTLESYYRFSPLLGDETAAADDAGGSRPPGAPGAAPAGSGEPGAAMDGK